ncbi:hypothetical protein [Candidatus Uabimicrobium sp. HlEnr_7]|uniref:hypothetical protein n=1 Tax=Candidatus Uabimicrobium helgolandensis TaxID=3095367 RepID=UPI0035564B0D
MLADYNSGGSWYGVYLRTMGHTSSMVYPPTGMAISAYHLGSGLYKGDTEKIGISMTPLLMNSLSVANHYKAYGFKHPWKASRKSWTTPAYEEISTTLQEYGKGFSCCDRALRFRRTIDPPRGRSFQTVHIERPLGTPAYAKPYFKGKYNHHVGLLEYAQTHETIPLSEFQNIRTIEPYTGKVYNNPFAWLMGEGYGGYRARLEIGGGHEIFSGKFPQPYVNIYYIKKEK